MKLDGDGHRNELVGKLRCYRLRETRSQDADLVRAGGHFVKDSYSFGGGQLHL
jgi:hypothetical protein